jgi:hypothetical protein
MARLVLVKVGERDGLPLYSPMDKEDAALCTHDVLVCDAKGERAKRTELQNRSIHKYCGMLAGQFNNAGLDMVAVLKEKETEVSWSMDAVKDAIWKPIQVALFPDKPSTTQLETHEVAKVYEQIARHMAVKFNINQSFPNRHGD